MPPPPPFTPDASAAAAASAGPSLFGLLQLGLKGTKELKADTGLLRRVLVLAKVELFSGQVFLLGDMDGSLTGHPGSPGAKLATPPGSGGVNPTDGVELPPSRRRRCPPPRGSDSTSGRMSVTNSETVVDDADMECSDGEPIDTDDEEEVG